MSPGIVAESDLQGNLTSEYVFFEGRRMARRDFPGGAVSYYFSDELKTADVITDSAGNIKSESDYFPLATPNWVERNSASPKKQQNWNQSVQSFYIATYPDTNYQRAGFQYHP